MDICVNFLVFLLGCLVLQCLNHILMTDSLLHMKRSALSCHEKKTWKNKTRPESTRPTGPISSRTLETVYSIMTYTQYIYIEHILHITTHIPHVLKTFTASTGHCSSSIPRAPGLLRWVPGQEQEGLHFIQKSWLRLRVKRWLILTKQITCNLHPPDLNSAYNEENSLVLLTVQESGGCNCTCSNW